MGCTILKVTFISQTTSYMPSSINMASVCYYEHFYSATIYLLYFYFMHTRFTMKQSETCLCLVSLWLCGKIHSEECVSVVLLFTRYCLLAISIGSCMMIDIIHLGMCMIVSFIICLTIVTLVIDCEVSNA